MKDFKLLIERDLNFLRNSQDLLDPMEWIIFNHMSEGLIFTPSGIEPECQ